MLKIFNSLQSKLKLQIWFTTKPYFNLNEQIYAYTFSVIPMYVLINVYEGMTSLYYVVCYNIMLLLRIVLI